MTHIVNLVKYRRSIVVGHLTMEGLVNPHIFGCGVENLDEITVEDVPDNQEPILVE